VAHGIHDSFQVARLAHHKTAKIMPGTMVAALMAANPSLKIEVQGHTDNIGGDDYNQKLSDARPTRS
jgi:hypothetical protein